MASSDGFCPGRRNASIRDTSIAKWVRVAMIAAVMAGVVASATSASAQSPQPPKRRVFVTAQDAAHKQAIQAIIGEQGRRHDYVSPGSEGIFSAELTRGEIRAVERLGGRVEPVPRVYPRTNRRHFGVLHRRVTPQGKPGAVCGDGKCDGGEKKSCPDDCGGSSDPVDDPPSCRAGLPQDQREYQTLLLSGDSAGLSAGDGVKLLVVDTGVNKNHPDLDVSFCRNATTGKVRNNCKDGDGHGTHTSGSAGANGGTDGLGLFGTAPGAMLGMEKVCTNLCWMDDLVRGIEDGTQRWDPDVMTISIGGPASAALKNAIDAAVAAGALVVSSAGNNGPGANTMGYPESYDNVLAVGALDAFRIAVNFSSRGIDNANDPNHLTISARELELAGGGFVIESTSNDGCYEVMSGTSMSAPSVAGFAAANWKGSAAATRTELQTVLAQDVDNSGVLGSYDGTTSGFDTSTGYGLPRNSGINGGIFANVTTDVQGSVPPSSNPFDCTNNLGCVTIDVTGPPNANYRIGISSPDGSWTFGEFSTDDGGISPLVLNPWTDPGTWLITVDFGGGATDFGAAYATFEQTN